jgi:hypothetical protein
MRRLYIASCLALGLCLLAVSAAAAHSISFLDGEAVVYRDKIELKLKVRPEDILLSGGMSIMIADRIEKAVITKGAEAHKKFLLNGLQITDAEGRRISGKVVKVELFRVPDGGIPLDELMTKTAVYALEYPLAKPPQSLGFRQHFASGEMSVPVVVQLAVRREGSASAVTVPVADGDAPDSVSFDWPKTVGAIASAAKPTAPKPAAFQPTEAFIYIRTDEVRVETLMPLAVLERWQPVVRREKNILEIAEQAAVRPTLEAWFPAQNIVKIDGVAVTPTLGRIDFLGLDIRDLAGRPEPKRLDAGTARVGAILNYSTKGAPRHVELAWTLFPDRTTPVHAVVFAYDKGSRVTFTPGRATWSWDTPGAPPLPKLEAISAQKGAGDEAARGALAETLLRNVYRGFDYSRESDIYDALAQSVAGDLRTELYLKIKSGLIVQEQGGAVAHVQEVKVTKSEPAADQPESGFAQRVTWQVAGTVEHWGHIHTRTNQYTAEVTVTPQENAWKITAMNVIRQSQVGNAISLRKF